MVDLSKVSPFSFDYGLLSVLDFEKPASLPEFGVALIDPSFGHAPMEERLEKIFPSHILHHFQMHTLEPSLESLHYLVGQSWSRLIEGMEQFVFCQCESIEANEASQLIATQSPPEDTVQATEEHPSQHQESGSSENHSDQEGQADEQNQTSSKLHTDLSIASQETARLPTTAILAKIAEEIAVEHSSQESAEEKEIITGHITPLQISVSPISTSLETSDATLTSLPEGTPQKPQADHFPENSESASHPLSVNVSVAPGTPAKVPLELEITPNPTENQQLKQIYLEVNRLIKEEERPMHELVDACRRMLIGG